MMTVHIVQNGSVIQNTAHCVKLLSVVGTGYVHTGSWNEVRTNCVQQNPFSKADSSSAGREILHIL
jgi:hypothetical protein